MKKKIAYILSFYLMFLFYKLYSVDQTSLHNGYEYFINIFGMLDFTNQKQFVWNVIFWLTPQLPLILLFSDYFERNVISNCSVLVYRYSSKSHIMTRNVIGLVVQSVLVMLLQLVITLVIGGMYRIPIWNIDLKLLLAVASWMLYLTFIIIVINIFSLFCNSIYIVIGILLSTWLQLFVMSVNDKHIFRYLPVNGGLQYIKNGQQFVENTISGSVSIGWSIIIILLGVVLVKKKKDYV